MKSFRIALAFSIAVHLLALVVISHVRMLSSAAKDQGHQGVLNVSFISGEPAPKPLEVSSSSTETDVVHIADLQPLEILQGLSPKVPELHTPSSTAISATTANIQAGPVAAESKPADVAGDQQNEIIGLKSAQDNHPTPTPKVHPPNWIAMMVIISPEGVVTDYSQVSKGDANSALYMMLINQIKTMKFSEDLYGRKLLISGPPLKIETDPDLIAEYF